MNEPDEIEEWIVARYGQIEVQSVVIGEGVLELHSASVRIYSEKTHSGIVTGMGATRQLAVHDLYEALCHPPQLPTLLTGFWRDRRDKLNKPVREALG